MCNPITVARPEDLIAKGLHDGYQWEIIHNGTGYRCGYVRIPKGHPWHGESDIDAYVHGGVTFAEADTKCDKGGEDNAWWLGFDCAHCDDLPDPSLPIRKALCASL